MSKQWITVKEAALKNNCPECFNNEGLTITYKQEYIETSLSKSITQNITTSMHCNTCNTAIYPERWTEDIERVYDYQMKAFTPKKPSKKFKLLFWVLIGIVIAIVAGIATVVTGYPELLSPKQ